MAKRWLVTGASGQLGGHVIHRLLSEPVNTVQVLARNPEAFSSLQSGNANLVVERADLGDLSRIEGLVDHLQPDVVLHLGAMTAVTHAYASPEVAQRVNAESTFALTTAARECGARMLYISSDMVFDGSRAPYSEADAPQPTSVYGRSKLAGEQAVGSDGLVVRLPLLYGFPALPRETTFTLQMRSLAQQQPLSLFFDEFRTPVSLPEAAEAAIGLARADLTGVIHIAGPERLSRLDLVLRCAAALRLPTETAVAVSRTSVESAEPRPADLSLDGTRFARLFPQWAPRPAPADLRPPELASLGGQPVRFVEPAENPLRNQS